MMGLEMDALHNMDCMDALRRMPDRMFELAIVDPPYGGPPQPTGDGSEGTARGRAGRASAAAGAGGSWQGRPRSRFGGLFDRYAIPANEGTGDIRHWDVAPPPEYFEELFRVSENQVIWGGNYFGLPPARCFLVWDKKQPEAFSMAMCEHAWTSFDANAKLFRHVPWGVDGDTSLRRIHPTQKPVALYRWVLGLFARPGDRILDTHVGSGSSIVACIEHGLGWMGFEIDPGYCAGAQERIDRALAQGRLDLFPPTGSAPAAAPALWMD